jgi:hypothetical protein
MTRAISVRWTMQANINDQPFEVTGKGTSDLDMGVTELHLQANPGFPQGFDPSLAQFMCNFTLAGYTASSRVPVSFRDAVEHEAFVRPRRQVELFDGTGETVVHLEALTSMTVSSDGILVTNSMTGFSRLTSSVASAVGQETLVPGEPGTATGLARFKVTLHDGTVLDGLTVVPYQFDRAVVLSPAVRALDEHTCTRTGLNVAHLRASSTWLPSSMSTATIGS